MQRGDLQRVVMSLVHAPVGRGRVLRSSEQKEHALMMRGGPRICTPCKKGVVSQYNPGQLNFEKEAK